MADDLVQYRQWAPRLRDLGECEVKHGVRLRLVNLYAEPLGNSELPEKFKAQAQKQTGAVSGTGILRRSPLIIATAILIIIAFGMAAFFYKASLKSNRAAALIPPKSIAVLPFRNLSEDQANAYLATVFGTKSSRGCQRLASSK